MRPFIDNPHAPLLYADAVSGWGIAGGNLRITLEVMHFNCESDATTQSAARVVVGTVAMPLDSAVSMARGILEFAELHRRSNEPTVEHAAAQDTVN